MFVCRGQEARSHAICICCVGGPRWHGQLRVRRSSCSFFLCCFCFAFVLSFWSLCLLSSGGWLWLCDLYLIASVDDFSLPRFLHAASSDPDTVGHKMFFFTLFCLFFFCFHSVEEAYSNEKKLEAEAKRLHANSGMSVCFVNFVKAR